MAVYFLAIRDTPWLFQREVKFSIAFKWCERVAGGMELSLMRTISEKVVGTNLLALLIDALGQSIILWSSAFCYCSGNRIKYQFLLHFISRHADKRTFFWFDIASIKSKNSKWKACSKKNPQSQMQKKTKHTHTKIPTPHSLSFWFRKATREKDGKLVSQRSPCKHRQWQEVGIFWNATDWIKPTETPVNPSDKYS